MGTQINMHGVDKLDTGTFVRHIDIVTDEGSVFSKDQHEVCTIQKCLDGCEIKLRHKWVVGTDKRDKCFAAACIRCGFVDYVKDDFNRGSR